MRTRSSATASSATPGQLAGTQDGPLAVRFVPNDRGNPAGKLADAELHFTTGPLDGLKLVGFAVWERRSGGRNVRFPARQYSVNGERRSANRPDEPHSDSDLPRRPPFPYRDDPPMVDKPGFKNW